MVFTAHAVVPFVDDWFRLSILVYSIKVPAAFDRTYYKAGANRCFVANLTRALGEKMNDRET